MQIKLSIKSDKSAGVLARIIVALRRINLHLAQQKMIEAADHLQIDLIVEEPEISEIELSGIIRAIPGVLELLSDEEPELYFEASSVDSFEPSSDADISYGSRGFTDPRAVAIAEAFPNIIELVIEYRESLANDQASELMFALGVEVAALRADMFKTVQEKPEMAEFATSRLIPDITGLANVEYSDGGLKVLSSVFTQDQEEQKPGLFGFRFGRAEKVEKCGFLNGYIQGVMEVTPGMKYVHVEESNCRMDGDPYCLFRFNEN
ncbi:MAG: hypothetical protein P8I38_07960 [Arenicella sp.]|jgi:hypothetical protein|nr:hypothetical protein [Arenicella sp.]